MRRLEKINIYSGTGRCAMASTFVIHDRRDWTFQLVLLGSRLQLEGWCEGETGPLRCSAWLGPLEDPHAVADTLIRQPRCCLGG